MKKQRRSALRAPKYLIYLFVSALLHVLLVIAFVFFPVRKNTFQSLPSPEPVYLQFTESIAPDVKAKTGSKREASRQGKRKPPASGYGEESRQTRLKTVDLSPHLIQKLKDQSRSGIPIKRPDVPHADTQAEDRAEVDPMSRLSGEGEGWSSSVQYANEMDLAFTNISFGFFQALHRKVDGALVYPDDFARQHVQGRIRIDAEVARNGQLVRFLSSESEDDLLHVYILALLIHALKSPLPERTWLHTDRALVTFDFDFRVRMENGPHANFMVGVHKNHLLFGREAGVESVLNEKVHELFTHYIPPIIPIPGGFYVDFYRAYQFARNLIEGAPTESKARQRRLEKLQETLKSTVRAGQPSQVKPAAGF